MKLNNEKLFVQLSYAVGIHAPQDAMKFSPAVHPFFSTDMGIKVH